jgi:hypothetical protein
MHYVDRWHLLLLKKDNVKDIFLYDNPEEIIGKKVLVNLLLSDILSLNYFRIKANK